FGLERVSVNEIPERLCTGDHGIRVEPTIVDTVLLQFQQIDKPTSYSWMAVTIGVSVRQNNVRDIQPWWSEGLHVGWEVRAANRAHGNTQHIQRDIERLCEGRNKEPLCVAFDQDHAACEEDLSTSDIDVALEIRLVALGERSGRGRNRDRCLLLG